MFYVAYDNFTDPFLMYMYMLNSQPFVCPIDLTPVERPVRVKHPLKKSFSWQRPFTGFCVVVTLSSFIVKRVSLDTKKCPLEPELSQN